MAAVAVPIELGIVERIFRLFAVLTDRTRMMLVLKFDGRLVSNVLVRGEKLTDAVDYPFVVGDVEGHRLVADFSVVKRVCRFGAG